MIIDMSKSVVLYLRKADREALSDPSMWDRVANAWGEEAGGWLQGFNFPTWLGCWKENSSSSPESIGLSRFNDRRNIK